MLPLQRRQGTHCSVCDRDNIGPLFKILNGSPLLLKLLRVWDLGSAAASSSISVTHLLLRLRNVLVLPKTNWTVLTAELLGDDGDVVVAATTPRNVVEREAFHLGAEEALERTDVFEKIVDEKQVEELDKVLVRFRAKDIPYLKTKPDLLPYVPSLYIL